MGLQEFVTKTLSQISFGVASAKTHDNRIAPKIGLREDDTKILRTFHGTDGVFLIEFDVAITSSKSTEKGAADGITVLSVASANGEAKRSIDTSSMSRVKFTVPISYW
jgi:hypothetical protein